MVQLVSASKPRQTGLWLIRCFIQFTIRRALNPSELLPHNVSSAESTQSKRIHPYQDWSWKIVWSWSVTLCRPSVLKVGCVRSTICLQVFKINFPFESSTQAAALIFSTSLWTHTIAVKISSFAKKGIETKNWVSFCFQLWLRKCTHTCSDESPQRMRVCWQSRLHLCESVWCSEGWDVLARFVVLERWRYSIFCCLFLNNWTTTNLFLKNRTGWENISTVWNQAWWLRHLDNLLNLFYLQEPWLGHQSNQNLNDRLRVRQGHIVELPTSNLSGEVLASNRCQITTAKCKKFSGLVWMSRKKWHSRRMAQEGSPVRAKTKMLRTIKRHEGLRKLSSNPAGGWCPQDCSTSQRKSLRCCMQQQWCSSFRPQDHPFQSTPKRANRATQLFPECKLDQNFGEKNIVLPLSSATLFACKGAYLGKKTRNTRVVPAVARQRDGRLDLQDLLVDEEPANQQQLSFTSKICFWQKEAFVLPMTCQETSSQSRKKILRSWGLNCLQPPMKTSVASMHGIGRAVSVTLSPQLLTQPRTMPSTFPFCSIMLAQNDCCYFVCAGLAGLWLRDWWELHRGRVHVPFTSQQSGLLHLEAAHMWTSDLQATSLHALWIRVEIRFISNKGHDKVQNSNALDVHWGSQECWIHSASGTVCFEFVSHRHRYFHGYVFACILPCMGPS